MHIKSYIGTGVGLILTVVCAVSVHARKNEKQEQGVSLHESPIVANDKETASIIKTGDVAPDFTVNMLDGRSLKLSELKGKVVLLNFWATWCGPCMKEFQVIPEKIIKRFEGDVDFVFLPISRGETLDTVQKKMEQLKGSGIDFPVGLDPDKSIYGLYANTYIPRNYLIDKEGKVVYTSIGYEENEFAGMVEMIAGLLK